LYHVEENPDVPDHVAALPSETLAPYAELRAALEVAPWSFPAAHKANPDGAVRAAVFGGHHHGLAVFVILEQPSGSRWRASSAAGMASSRRAD
jgi:hypothetical protein